MTIGIVALDSVAQPEDFLHAEKIAQSRFDFVRASDWDCDSCSAGTIRMSAARRRRSHQSSRPPKSCADKKPASRISRDARRHDFIEIARRIFAAPRVVIPIDDRNARLFLARDENRTVIAAPWFVCRNQMKGEPTCVKPIENCARFCFMRAVANVDIDRFRFQQRFHHCAQRRQNAIEAIRETDSLAARPRKPCRRVRFPFRRHPIAAVVLAFASASSILVRPRSSSRRCCEASSGGNSRRRRFRVLDKMRRRRFQFPPAIPFEIGRSRRYAAAGCAIP